MAQITQQEPMTFPWKRKDIFGKELICFYNPWEGGPFEGLKLFQIGDTEWEHLTSPLTSIEFRWWFNGKQKFMQRKFDLNKTSADEFEKLWEDIHERKKKYEEGELNYKKVAA